MKTLYTFILSHLSHVDIEKVVLLADLRVAIDLYECAETVFREPGGSLGSRLSFAPRLRHRPGCGGTFHLFHNLYALNKLTTATVAALFYLLNGLRYLDRLPDRLFGVVAGGWGRLQWATVTVIFDKFAYIRRRWLIGRVVSLRILSSTMSHSRLLSHWLWSDGFTVMQVLRRQRFGWCVPELR